MEEAEREKRENIREELEENMVEKEEIKWR